MMMISFQMHRFRRGWDSVPMPVVFTWWPRFLHGLLRVYFRLPLPRQAAAYGRYRGDSTMASAMAGNACCGRRPRWRERVSGRRPVTPLSSKGRARIFDENPLDGTAAGCYAVPWQDIRPHGARRSSKLFRMDCFTGLCGLFNCILRIVPHGREYAILPVIKGCCRLRR